MLPSLSLLKIFKKILASEKLFFSKDIGFWADQSLHSAVWSKTWTQAKPRTSGRADGRYLGMSTWPNITL